MGTTANRGWPYPESSDFVADGATAIENLADAIDASLGEGFAYVETVYFTTNGSFTKASYPWLRAVKVKLVGGGGAGGGAAATTSTQGSAGAGGAGAGYAEKFILASSLSASETVTVGAGGVPVTGGTGGSGGQSSFGSHATGDGGNGGTINAATAGTAGVAGPDGAGGTGDLVIRGQRGGGRLVVGGSSFQQMGNGGASHLGFGYVDNTIFTFLGSNPGNAPSSNSYGGAGNGSRNGGAQSAISGGAGASGIVIVELYA